MTMPPRRTPDKRDRKLGDAATPPSSATQLPVQPTTPNNRADNWETRQAVKNMQAVINMQAII
jgi:hypothetical protein